MQKWVGLSTAVVAALVLLCQGADAGTVRRQQDDKRLFAAGVVAGTAGTVVSLGLRDWSLKHPRHAKVSDGGALVIGTFACWALTPIISTIAVQRELTLREAYVMSADCVIPFVGGWLMNKAFDNHPEWEGRQIHQVRERRHRR